MLHFVINPYCPKLHEEIPAICKDLYGDGRALAVMEKKPDWHVHVQGDPVLNDNEVTTYLKELATKHSRRAVEPGCRPVKRRKTVADIGGLSYMMKYEDSVVVHSNGFSDDELREYKIESDRVREELKHSMAAYIREHCSPCADPAHTHALYRRHGLRFYVEQDKKPVGFQSLVLWAMAGIDCPDHFTYVSERI